MAVPLSRARFAGVVASVLATLVCGTARADDPDPKRDSGFLSLEAVATRWSTIPSLTLAGPSAPRLLVGLGSPAVGPVTTYGVGGDFGVRIGWIDLSIVHLRYSGASSPISGTATADESPVGVTFGALNVLEIGLPALVPPRVGFQLVGDHFKLGAALEWGLTYAWASASFSDPIDGPTSGVMNAWSGYVRADVSACLLLHKDETDEGSKGLLGDSWACLTAMPSLYDFGWGQGQSVGVRIDL
jgi:hypothetical protein